MPTCRPRDSGGAEGFMVRILERAVLLADPPAVHAAVEKLARMPNCPTAREVAEVRRARLEDASKAATRAMRAASGKVGVIPIYGPLDQRMSSELMKLGGTSTEEIGAALDALLAEPSVSSIIFDVDSPGGYSSGIQELSDKIYHARGRKRTYAIANSMAGSAAYWLATAAETMVVTPGGYVGSVGAYNVHVDESKALEQQGIKVTVVSAGKYKTELANVAPLSEDARGYLQSVVDHSYTAFVQALKRNRGVGLDTVRRDFGEGRMVNAPDAQQRQMADKVMSFEELFRRVSGRDATASGAKASVEMLRLRHKEQVQRAEREFA